jgi:hypothetical protein
VICCVKIAVKCQLKSAIIGMCEDNFLLGRITSIVSFNSV